MSGLKSLQQILPLKQHPLPESNASSITTNSSLEHHRATLEQSDEVNLGDYLEQFQEYNQHLKQYKERLVPVGEILREFSDELNNLSSSIIALEQQSSNLSKDSKHQKDVIEKLNPVILDVMIPPEIAKSILLGEITPQWVENLKFITEKKQTIPSLPETKSKEQLETGVKLLELKAVERIRDFMIGEIRKLRSSSKSSSQLIQLKLLEVKETFQFMQLHHKQLADQLTTAYVYTMRWYYQSKFSKYLYALEKIHIRRVDTPVLGDHKSGEYLTLFDKRAEILHSDQSAIPSQIAETSPFPYWVEFVFNQFSLALVDNIIVEYLFMIEFFFQGNEKDSKWAGLMFKNVFEIGKEFLTYISNTADAYGILFIIRLVQSAEKKLHEMHIPVLDDYLNSLLLILWPHFTQIIDLNCESMKKAIVRSKKVQGLAPISTTQQFAQYFLALLRLSVNQAEPLVTCITRLRNEYESYLAKSTSLTSTEKEVFLYNNYFLVLSVLKNETANPFIEEQIEHFQMLTDAYTKH
ncbi:Vacuolar protein sorting-associated protein 52 [Candida viswanathii]|uniref:Vacuolar protein sorting-associated protein 52 n=1 Tax=Candida viswanathii TaxID=5486 RepID=A0A367XVT3_9ASCO|nr:Vacuolar protein sorting-associated protein 52 [Candida viswanathii]